MTTTAAATDRIAELLRNNRRFVEAQLRLDPQYFEHLAEGPA